MNIKDLIHEISYAIISDSTWSHDTNKENNYFFIPGEDGTAFADEFYALCIEKANTDCPLGEGWLFDEKGIDTIRKRFHQEQVIYVELFVECGYLAKPL